MTKLYQRWKDYPITEWRWPDFSPQEMACKGTGKLMLDPDAMDKLQSLRTRLGKPLIITSAYRSPEHNRNVGGAKSSYHMKGVAFDVRQDNHNPAEFLAAAKEVGFTGFGTYPKSGFIHVDTGPARKWGRPFPASATNLSVEPPARSNPAKSTTIQAAGATGVATATGAATAISQLDGTAQLVVIGATVVVALAVLWIMRERLRKWAEGDR